MVYGAPDPLAEFSPSFAAWVRENAGPVLPADTDPAKPCFAVPCLSLEDASIVQDTTFVPTLEDVRQAGGPWAGPPGYYYTERDGRVVLLADERI